TVAVIGGAMYAQYRAIQHEQCIAMPAGTQPADAASSFVNPLTALGMVETMRTEGHTALVHTAAASNLGQMLNRICLKDGIGLVNIVRRQDQEDLLRQIGAVHVCNSSAPDFGAKLVEALKATGATIAFDATGGGRLASQILSAMETAITASSKEFNRYGSTTHKQVYLYGGLDRSPTELVRNFGMAWGVGGWLLFPFLHRAGKETVARLHARVAAELTTTFASHYTRTVSLAEAVSPEVVALYGKAATGSKFLIDPTRDA
ncbi:MAG: NADH oxidase, partial [Burkholderiaceae bacterium]